MSDWRPALYLEFEKERTQPAIDLVTRVLCEDPAKIIDIGCGPGNSANVLKSRWKQAKVIGLDNSRAMIDKAKLKYGEIEWICADAAADLTHLGQFDIVFSNAAIQWLPAQELLLAKLYGMLTENGILAVQVPCVKYMPLHIELEKLASSSKWKRHFFNIAALYSIHTADFYYDTLCKLTKEFDLWETAYYHVMDAHKDILKWYSGSGLKPYLDCLKNDSLVNDFLGDFEMNLKEAYPIQADGKVLFPFTRIFFTAKKI